MTDFTTILVGAVGSILGGSGVWVWLSGVLKAKGTREESEIGRLRVDLQKLRTELKACEERHDFFEARIAGLEQAQESHLARWIKDASHRIMWVNPKAFLTIFAPLGYKREELDGKTFRDLLRLTREAVLDIERLDEAALARDGLAQSTAIQFHPLLPLMNVVKIATSGKTGELIYEGYAYRTNDPELEGGMQAGRQIEAIKASTEHMLTGREPDSLSPGADKPPEV